MGHVEEMPMNAKQKWNRTAYIYRIISTPMEMMGARKWRKELFSRIPEGEILEIGVGLGANMEFYPAMNRRFTGIDISPRMLEAARKAASETDVQLKLLEMDAEKMDLPSDSFDAIVSTCVFCSIPDANAAFREAKRVLKKGGTAYFIEHMRPEGGIRGKIFDMLNPVTSRLLGVNINRRTENAIRESGFEIVESKHLMSDIFRFIIARKA